MLKIIRKIKKKGLSGCFNSLKFRIAMKLYAFFSILPIKKNKIVFCSDGDFCDNAEALYQYLYKNAKSDYQYIWLVLNPQNYSNCKNVKFVKKPYSICMFFHLATCKFYFYDHEHYYNFVKKRSGQKAIYLAHGFRNKQSKLESSKYKNSYDYVISIGDLDSRGRVKLDECAYEKILKLGYPRCDYFFQDNLEIKKKVNEIYQLHSYNKVFLWMPTFRKSILENLSEDYICSESGITILPTHNDFNILNDFLRAQNAFVVFKVHYLQADLAIFSCKFSNIVFVTNDNLNDINIQLYQFIPLFDALITDFSSIFVDYLLLKKPIIFVVDDIQEYRKHRGIWPENILDYMVGEHVVNLSELQCAIERICLGNDVYLTKRENVVSEFHTYMDGNSAKRIVDYFGL